MKVEVPCTYLRKYLIRNAIEKSGDVAPIILNGRH